MGTVHLTSGHHGLLIRDPNADLSQRKVFDPSWLERPITNVHGDNIYHHHQQVNKAAIRALMALPFDSAISYYEHSGQLQLPKRTWAEIMFRNKPSQVIVGFSHDSRKDNAPHRYVHQWVEHLWKPELHELAWEEWSDPKRWENFFLLRIEYASDESRQKASQLQIEAGRLLREANKVRSVLKKNSTTR